MNKYVIKQVTIGTRILLFAKKESTLPWQYSGPAIKPQNYRYGGKYILLPENDPVYGKCWYYLPEDSCYRNITEHVRRFLEHDHIIKKYSPY